MSGVSFSSSCERQFGRPVECVRTCRAVTLSPHLPRQRILLQILIERTIEVDCAILRHLRARRRRRSVCRATQPGTANPQRSASSWSRWRRQGSVAKSARLDERPPYPRPGKRGQIQAGAASSRRKLLSGGWMPPAAGFVAAKLLTEVATTVEAAMCRKARRFIEPLR